MGSQVSQEERSIVNIWTSLLAKQGIKYDRHQLKALLLSCKSQGIEANSENAFSVTTWEQVGLLILESDSQGDEIARSVMTTWQVVLDALRMLKKEWDMENQTPADGEGQSGKEGWVEEAGCTPPQQTPPSFARCRFCWWLSPCLPLQPHPSTGFRPWRRCGVGRWCAGLPW